MPAITICSDFGAQKNKIWHCFHCLHIYFPWSDGTRCHNLSFLNVIPVSTHDKSCAVMHQLKMSSITRTRTESLTWNGTKGVTGSHTWNNGSRTGFRIGPFESPAASSRTLCFPSLHFATHSESYQLEWTPTAISESDHIYTHSYLIWEMKFSFLSESNQ